MGIHFELPILFLFVVLSIPCIAAQNIRTTTFFPEPILPTLSSLPPLPNVSQPPLQPSSGTQSVSTIVSIIANTLVAVPSGFPSPLPDGIARTASGKPIPCSPKNTKLNPTTHKLISECVETAFCAAPPGSPPNATGLGMCFPRLCRRDEFPFGYGVYGGGTGRKKNATIISIPPMCPPGAFCPDNGSGCRLQVGLGETCELARDEQCAPLTHNPKVRDEDNKARCLNGICLAATQQLGESCQIENTTYVSDINRGAAGGGQFTTHVIKHNCLSPDLFCDPTPSGSTGPTCQKTKELSDKCRFDAECGSNNCATPANTCIPNVEKAYQLAAWHWFATVLFIVLLLASTVTVLTFIHRRQRYARYQEMQEYYHEQMSLRRSILALHAAAAAEKSPGHSTDIFLAKHKEAGRI